ncbi:MAG: nicotinate-nucleotide--dimethylbenzimidazole phosphoribosyltransferase [Verrucomicrobiae bacterium]|nr:nicotinate-nucleotide--dimethylbenzimidazole phosphoribosyltransferase [Verrucomicrobiae bacterium]
MSLLDDTIGRIKSQDAGWRAMARTRLEKLTMPHWALGRLMDLAEDLAGMTRSIPPVIQRKAVAVFAADHGVALDGVSRYPREVTQQMVHNFVRGGAGINVLARLAGARVVVVDMGVAGDLSGLAREGKIVSHHVADGTANIAKGPAMTPEQARRCLEAGIEVALQLGKDADLLATGEMGIGNTTPSSAIVAAVAGVAAEGVTGGGTGVENTQFLRKMEIINHALEINRPDSHDGLDLLAKVGGFEIGGIAGLILGAAAQGKPVLVDGFISTAGALVAQRLSQASTDYMIAAHRSAERGHRIALVHLGKQPLLDLDLRLGEGTGAALAMNLVEAAARILTEVATFEEAAVSGANA